MNKLWNRFSCWSEQGLSQQENSFYSYCLWPYSAIDINIPRIGKYYAFRGQQGNLYTQWM